MPRAPVVEAAVQLGKQGARVFVSERAGGRVLGGVTCMSQLRKSKPRTTTDDSDSTWPASHDRSSSLSIRLLSSRGEGRGGWGGWVRGVEGKGGALPKKGPQDGATVREGSRSAQAQPSLAPKTGPAPFRRPTGARGAREGRERCCARPPAPRPCPRTHLKSTPGNCRRVSSSACRLSH